MTEHALRDLVEYVTRSLVDAPDAVDLRDATTGDARVLELRVAPDDLGKIIGRKGGTARAIRTVLYAAASKTRSRVVLNIVEE